MAVVHPPVSYSIPKMALKSATSTVAEITSQQAVPSMPHTVDDLIQRRAKSHADTPLIAYPRSIRGCADFAEYTAKDLDRFADEIARGFHSQGLQPAVSLFPPQYMD
jgi:hypothetical protein